MDEYVSEIIARYQSLGRAVVELAIKDYIRYIKAMNRNYNSIDTTAEIYTYGRQAQRFLKSKEANYLAGLDYRIDMVKEIDKRYVTDRDGISNYYYREINKRRKEQDDIIIK